MSSQFNVSNRKIVATIEARMNSNRLPGKVLLPAAGKPMLKHLIDRLSNVTSIDQIIIATTTNKLDDEIEAFAINNNIACFRGSEDDVMSRVIGAADSIFADIIVEITGDCPIIDPQIIEHSIRTYLVNDVDYLSNSHIRSFPDGMDTQVYSLSVLKKSASLTNDPLDHEHVTLHIRNNPDIFSHLYLLAPPEIHWPELGLTLDDIRDYQLLEKIILYFDEIKPLFSCFDAIQLLKNNLEWIEINKEVVRKGDN